MTEPEMFTTEWRAWRVKQGDAYLKAAIDRGRVGHPGQLPADQVHALIALAQAHYQAANIRSRPGESWLASKTLTVEETRKLKDNL